MNIEITPEKRNIIFFVLLGGLTIASLAFCYSLSTDLEAISNRLASAPPPSANISRNNQTSSSPSSSRFILAFSKCKMVSKIVPLDEKEYEEQLKKMERIGKKASDAPKVKVIDVEVCPLLKFCDTTNALSNIQFNKKNYESAIVEFNSKAGKYSIDNNNLILKPSEFEQRILTISAWNAQNNILELIFNGKKYTTADCKSPELEKIESDRQKADLYNKEVQEAEKIREALLQKEKLENEIKEREKFGKEILEKIKSDNDRLAQLAAEVEKIQNEKRIKEAIEQANKENAAAAREKLEKEKAEKMKIKVKSF